MYSTQVENCYHGQKRPWLIHSANPQSRPVGIIVFAHIVRPSVSTFQNITIQNKVAIGETVGLAEWIIDDTCLVAILFMVVAGIEKTFFSILSMFRGVDIVFLKERSFSLM